MSRFLSAVSVVLLFVLSAEAFAQSDSTEPPQTFELTVNGETQTVQLDQEFELDLKGKTKLKLKALPTRQFKFAGLSFPYPSFFAFEAEHDAESKLWTLDGSDCVVMVFGFPNNASVDHAMLARQIGAQFGRGTKFSETKFESKRFAFDGTRISANVVGARLSQEVFQIPTEDGTRIFVIQDGLNDDGSHTKEYRDLKKMLQEHLKITSKKLGYE